VAANHAAAATAGAAGPAVVQANANLQAARNALAKTQADEATATKNLKNASDQFTVWQKKGGTALQEAERAAGVAGLALGAVAIGSRPVAGAINEFVDGWSGPSSVSAFGGYQASGGGGGPLASWSGLFQAGMGATATATGAASLAGVSGALSAS